MQIAGGCWRSTYLSEDVGSIRRASSSNFLVELAEIVEEALRIERSELGVVDCAVSAGPGHVVGNDIDHEGLNLFQGLAMCQTKHATKKSSWMRARDSLSAGTGALG